MPNPVYTIGHSNHPLEAFIALLERHRIEEVADVRTYPRSRYNPCFNRDALERALTRRGVRYLFLGANSADAPPTRAATTRRAASATTSSPRPPPSATACAGCSKRRTPAASP